MTDETRPPHNLRVIKSEHPVVDGSPMIRLPSTLIARSPVDRSACKVRISREDVSKAVRAGRVQPAIDFWSLLARKVPPLPFRTGEITDGLLGLSDAHACFVGVRRPMGEEETGEYTAAYILKPIRSFAYDRRPPVPSAYSRPVPEGFVFAAYVVLDQPPATNGVVGVLTHWSFIPADPQSPGLPKDYKTRYVDHRW